MRRFWDAAAARGFRRLKAGAFGDFPGAAGATGAAQQKLQGRVRLCAGATSAPGASARLPAGRDEEVPNPDSFYIYGPRALTFNPQ